MKIKLKLGEITVPLVIEEAFRKAKEEGLKNKDKQKREWWEQFDDDAECFCGGWGGWWGEQDGREMFEPSEVRLVDKEIAEFLIAMTVNEVPSGGGYPKEEWMTFEDNGFRYTVCAYGWSGNSEAMDRGGCDISLIAYKEKIEEVKNENKG